MKKTVLSSSIFDKLYCISQSGLLDFNNDNLDDIKIELNLSLLQEFGSDKFEILEEKLILSPEEEDNIVRLISQKNRSGKLAARKIILNKIKDMITIEDSQDQSGKKTFLLMLSKDEKQILLGLKVDKIEVNAFSILDLQEFNFLPNIIGYSYIGDLPL